MCDVYYVSGMKNILMSTGQLLQKEYKIYMEDNHCVIMDKYPTNQLIARIEMTSNIMFPLTLKSAKKKNTVLAISKEKYVRLETAFTTESACRNN
jgi:hypothetical protein